MNDISIAVEFYTRAKFNHHDTPHLHSQFHWSHSNVHISTLFKFLANLPVFCLYLWFTINVLASVLIISMATAYLNFIISDNAR